MPFPYFLKNIFRGTRKVKQPDLVTRDIQEYKLKPKNKTRSASRTSSRSSGIKTKSQLEKFMKKKLKMSWKKL